MLDEVSKKIVDVLKEGFGEKTLIENMLKMENHPKKLKSIGYNKDINSKFKNELFDEIYEDEHGHIIDLRICNERPTWEELDDMSEYKDELNEIYEKISEPVFIIVGTQ